MATGNGDIYSIRVVNQFMKMGIDRRIFVAEDLLKTQVSDKL